MKHILVIVLFLLPAYAAAQQINAIQEAMSAYDYEKAIELIDRETPTTGLLTLKGRALKGLFRYEEAITSLKQAIEKDPQNIQLLLDLAECNKLAGYANDALACYEKVLEINPEHTYCALQRVNLLFAVERYPETKEACAKMLEKDSTAMVLRLMAQTYQALLHADTAEIYYKKAIEKNPKDYLSVARLSVIFVNDKEYKETIELTENYRALDKNNLYVNRQNAQAYCLNKDYTTAIDRYLDLKKMGDNSKMTHYYLGMAYFADEKFYEAQEELMEAYRHDPNNINVLYYLGRACAKTSWKPEGVEYLKTAIELTIPSPDVLAKLYEGLAECYGLNGEFRNQIATILEQYKHQPKNNLLYKIGHIYQDFLRDNKNAEKYLVQFLKTKPKEDKAAEPTMEGITVILGESNLYNAAEKRLETIRKESFWKGDKDAN